MIALSDDAAHDAAAGFHHDALMYSGLPGFLEGTVPFIRQGLEAEEPTLVVVDRAKIEMLQDALNGDAGAVQFADMADVGANPARIIPALREFVDTHAPKGRALRGIGEPIYPERSAVELVECQRHEALLNVAFADARNFTLVCPYDIEALDPEVIEVAHRTHPRVQAGATRGPSREYLGLEAIAAPFTDPLPDPPPNAHRLQFDIASLHELRAFVGEVARAAGIGPARTTDLVSAVSELATNSIRHGGGGGLLRAWRNYESLICEVIDRGRIDDPLAGREVPRPDQPDGRGLWLANQLCDLVQIRSIAAGSAVRLHMQA